ncbi:hypothetical protein OXX80_000174 [Metschnikowia pulcherrima]
MLSKKHKVLLATAVASSMILIYAFLMTDVPILQKYISPIWKTDSSGEYYVLKAQWAERNPVLKSLLQSAENEPVSQNEVKEFISQRLRRPDGDFVKNIEEEVREKYTEEFTKSLARELEQNLRKNITESRYQEQLSSHKLEEEMKSRYLKENGALLKNEIIKTFLAETSDEELKLKIGQLDSLSIDSGGYFKNIITKIIDDFKPSGKGVLSKGKSVPSNGLREVTNPPKSRKDLTRRRTRVKPEDVEDLRKKHDGFVAFLRALSTPPMDIYSGNGILLAAGKKHMIGALNAVIQLREMGSELPVELVLDSKADYNKRFCEKVLPRFNGKCLVIEEILGSEVYGKIVPEGFPMKAIALVLSSFDNTIYIDSDTFVIKNVDSLLTSQPFLQTKFVLWPDNWHKGTSPIFYDIARLVPGEPVRRDGLSNEESFASYISKDKNTEILFHDLDGLPPFTSVESGQLVFSKREHFRSLFLALYYNLHGEKYYYPLLYQGVFGSGDRETFVPALHVMNEPYYLTDWEMKFSGVTREKANEPGEFYFDESTMVQSEPGAAMKFRQTWKVWLLKQGLDSRLNPFQNGEYTQNLVKKFFGENENLREPEPLFMHVHSPKINALFNEISTKSRYDYLTRSIKEIDGGDKQDRLGSKDWELQFQAINTWSACEGMNDNAYWDSFHVNRKEVCKKLKEYLEILKQDSSDVEAANLKFLRKSD